MTSSIDLHSIESYRQEKGESRGSGDKKTADFIPEVALVALVFHVRRHSDSEFLAGR
ncbi:hypothetical protein PQR05_38095 [Paraburkholderia sediminicola]|uniref:hypothetical protein n=1 Tax=Paraburkholderia sediminicola TaxID=458836 RepID=UPI0038BBCB18